MKRTIKTYYPTEYNSQKIIDILEGNEPCNFEGCEDIIQEYKTKKNTSGGCAGCRLNGLRKQYSQMIRSKLPSD